MSPSRVPEDRRYTRTHEWVRAEGEEYVLGVTDHAQSELTDIVFVDLPPLGRTVAEGASALTLESVKTVADVYAPFAATIVAVNEGLRQHPEWVNQDPYGNGWLVRLRPTGPVPPEALWSAAQYRASIGEA